MLAVIACSPHERQPFAFRHLGELLAVVLGKGFADGLQIVARIEAVGDVVDLLAKASR